MAALEVGHRTFPNYSHRNSPKRFTQPQLFALVVLKHFLKTDYRGVIQLVIDQSDLRRALGLKRVPHHSTLYYAEQRLLKKDAFRLPSWTDPSVTRSSAVSSPPVPKRR